MVRFPRKDAILTAVVHLYAKNGTPVASSAVAKHLSGRLGPVRGLSAASIRAEMSALSKSGFLEQAHASGGRVPTEAGIRAFLDNDLRPKLHPWDRKQLQAAGRGSVAEVPALLSQTLAGLSGQVAIVAVPRFAGRSFREVGLARCGVGRFVVYFVSPGDVVQQTLVEVDFDLNASEVDRIHNFLNDRLTHRTLREVRELIQEELASHEAQRDRLRRSALEIGLRALPSPEIDLVVHGTAGLAAQPEFADRMHLVLQAIQDKTALLGLLDRMLEQRGVTVMLASEHRQPGMAGLSCVGAACGGNHGGAGVTLMGPARMDYPRLVPMVRHATEVLGRLYGQLYPNGGRP